jgi:Fe-S-cluster containining protein
MKRAEQVSAVERAYARADQLFAAVMREGELLGYHYACQRGCAACCTYPVSATVEEGEVIADAVQALPTPTRLKVVARLAAWNRAWASYSRGRLGAGHVALEWQVKRVACPFLNLDTHECQVYATRPLACRVHHACNLDPRQRQRAQHQVEQCGCAIEDAPGGCWTTRTMAEHGHPSAIVQIDVQLQEKALGVLMHELNAAGAETVNVGMLPEVVWLAGSRRYGWRLPLKLVAVPMLQTSFPKGAESC